MNYQNNIPDASSLFRKTSADFCDPNTEAFEYEDTFFKDLADDIKQSQEQVNQKLDAMIAENAKSEQKANRIAFITLIVGILTLIATVAGIVIQFL